MGVLMKELNEIQQQLRAPKGQRNAFGNYNYRSCEDILEAVKPLLNDCSLTISDEIIHLGDRFYVKATAVLFNDKEHVKVSALARESEIKKGMDSAQVTGAASSYARKYALNGLFAIDDTKDADTKDNSYKATQSTQQPQKNTGPMLAGDYVIQVGKKFKGQMLKTIDDLELSNFSQWISTIGDAKPIMLQTKMAIDIYLKEKGAIK